MRHFPDEVSQCVLDIVTWLDENALSLGLDDVAPAADEAINALEAAVGTVPNALKLLLREHDGAIPLGDYTLLPAASMRPLAASESKGGEGPPAGFLPFARDVDGGCIGLVPDKEGAPNAVRTTPRASRLARAPRTWASPLPRHVGHDDRHCRLWSRGRRART